jgi:hypothetical protein
MAEAGFLPCLYSNKSIEGDQKSPLFLSTKHRKSSSALAWNVQELADQFGIERLGFLTLTFADHVLDAKEAQRRFNSLRTNVLKSRYRDFIRVIERQKSGRIHYHLLIVLDADIRTGFDFEAVKNQDYKTACSELWLEWKFWRETAKKYGFGRTELLPVKSTAEGIARYVGKYIGKHMNARKQEDKGLHLVAYSTGARMASARFSWATPNAAIWRYKLGIFAQMICLPRGYPVPSSRGLRECLGRHWLYRNREFIMSLPYPVNIHAMLCHDG